MQNASSTKSNITWHPSRLSPEDRLGRLGMKGCVVWFTGLSGSGKSTIAREVEKALVQLGKHAFVLDGDNMRHGLNSDLDFSPDHRRENVRRVSEVAKLFADANVICLAALVSPYRADRDTVRKSLPQGRFLEVYCQASVEECESRDPKGLYKKARKGEITDFTGISAPYEAPEKPELTLQTGKETVQESVKKVLDFLRIAVLAI